MSANQCVCPVARGNRKLSVTWGVADAGGLRILVLRDVVRLGEELQTKIQNI